MPSKRLFNGIAHDIAHHAQSWFGGFHPHVAEACRALGVADLEVNLISPQSWPPDLAVQTELESAADGIQDKFRRMVTDFGLNITDISSARLSFHPVAGKDDHTTEVCSWVQVKGGRSFSHTI